MKIESDKKMKFNLIIIEFLVYVVVGIVLSVSVFYVIQSRNVNQKVISSLEQLKKVSDDKKTRIDSYINGVKNEVEELAMMDETKNFFKEKLVSSELAIKLDVDQQTEIIAEEIKNFIKANPKKTLNDLQKDNIFQNIAVQEVGYNGYSILEEYTERTVLFHKDRNLIGKILAETNTDLPEHQELTELSKQNMDVGGFYDWREGNGKIRRKYMRLIYLNQKTADGVELLLITTGYIDNYKVVKDALKTDIWNNYQKYINENDFDNLVFVTPDGYLSLVKKYEKNIGTNLNWNHYNNSELAKIYFEADGNKEINISKVTLDRFGEDYPKFLMIKPVFENEKLLGFVVLVKNMKNIYEILTKSGFFFETEESYLVEDRDRLLISPLIESRFDILVQNIKTDNANNCFNNQENFLGTMVGYDGENMLGVHTRISETDWCLLTEIKEKNILETNSESRIFLQIIVFGFFLTLGIIKMFRQIKGRGKIKIVIMFEKFMANLKLGYGLLFSLIIGFGFSFGFKMEKWSEFWLNNTFYLFSLFVLMMAFFYGFKLKNELDKKLVTRGTMLAFLARIVLTISQQNFFEESFRATALWTSASILGFIGMLLFFYGFIGETQKHDN